MSEEAVQTVESTVSPAVLVPETPVGETALNEDAQLETAWAKFHPEERVERAENGKFVSSNPDKASETPLEGGGGEEPTADPSTVTADVPLPANWQGKDELWSKIPVEARGEIATFQNQQHAKLSELGRAVAAYEPIHNVGQDVVNYLNEAAQRQGAAYDGPTTPAEGVAYLFNIQRMMDADPVTTILQIADTYGTRDKLAAALGVTGAPQGDQNKLLLAEIAELKRTIASNRFDPAMIEQVVDQKTARAEHDKEVSRLLSSKPLANEIEPDDLVFFINKAWKALGQDAAKQAVFDHAYNAAVEANPTLRAKSQAVTSTAKDAAEKAEAAKRGSSVNVKSTAQTAPRKQSEDEAMEEVWRKHH